MGWEAKAKEVVVWYYRADCDKSDEELRADVQISTSPRLSTRHSKRLDSGSVAVLDFGGDKTATAGTFTIQFPAFTTSAAILRLT